MKHRLMVPLLAVLCLFLSVPLAQAWTYVNFDYYPTGQRDDYLGMDDTHPSAGATSAVGQSFTADYTGWLLRASFHLQTPGAPDGNLIAALYAHSGTYGTSSVPTGAALATSAPIAANTLTGGYVVYNFAFTGANRVVLTAGQHYCIAVYRTATADSVSVGTDSSAPSHDGNGFTYTSGAWTASATDDVIFYVATYTFGSGDGTYSFYIDNPVYENNTDAGAVIVSASLPGGVEEFPVGNDVLFNATDLPTSFSWPVYSATRHIYVTESEDFTVTVPYDTIGVYSMTVKDRTATGGSTTAYLEAWRSIGGSEVLVERMKIIFGNPTPLNLMVGSVYHIKVLFEDGSTFDWGYFTATSTTSVTIIIREVEFGDGAQMLFGTIHVGAERDGSTITVDYLDDRNNTVWANVTIRVRNGAIVLSAPRNNDTYTLNWASANTSLSYTVTVAGQHTDFGVWGRSWTFDPSWSYPAFPNLSGIWGTASNDLLPFLLVVATMLIFAVKWQARGLIAGCAMASFLSLFGAASWSYYWLAFAWFIAIMININTGGDGS